MSSIALPDTHRRALLRSFWFVISTIAGLVVAAVLGWSLKWTLSIGIGLAVTLLLVTLVFLHERFIWLFYKGWNRLIIRSFATISRHIVQRLCYFIVFVTVGRAGSRLTANAFGRSESSWVERDSRHRRDEGIASRTGWIRGYLSWAFRSHNVWAISLLPFLAILRACSQPQAEPTLLDIYTLF